MPTSASSPSFAAAADRLRDTWYSPMCVKVYVSDASSAVDSYSVALPSFATRTTFQCAASPSLSLVKVAATCGSSRTPVIQCFE